MMPRRLLPGNGGGTEHVTARHPGRHMRTWFLYPDPQMREIIRGSMQCLSVHGDAPPEPRSGQPCRKTFINSFPGCPGLSHDQRFLPNRRDSSNRGSIVALKC